VIYLSSIPSLYKYVEFYFIIEHQSPSY
jgi:hypothetical protein